MKFVVRSLLFGVAVTVGILGLWGLIANLAIPLMPDYGKTEWNFFDESQSRQSHVWWAISFQTPYAYLDPVLAGPIGYGFYTLCLAWSTTSCLLLRPSRRPGQSPLVRTIWLVALLAIVAHLAFFAYVAVESVRIEKWKL
jgi:hypothetical protein